MTDLKDYTEITDVNFEFEGAHIAVVHKVQGGAANGVHSALITKATKDIDASQLEEVEKNLRRAKVTIPLDDFLEYFSALEEQEQESVLIEYEQRAEGEVPVLAGDYIESRVNSMDFLKSVNKESIKDLTDDQFNYVVGLVSDFEKGLLSGNSPEGDGVPEGTKIVTKKTQKGEDNNMSDKDNQATMDELAVIKASLQEQAEIVKQLKEENDILKAEKEAKIEAELIEKAKGFEFVSEEQASVVGKLFKSLDTETLTVLLDVFKSAQEKLVEKANEDKVLDENEDMFVQKSASGESELPSAKETSVDLVNKALGLNKSK